MNVVSALAEVMSQVQSVSKSERNDQQRFMFRGIDAVINKVGPALRAHGVIFVPAAQTITSEQYSTAKGAQMRNVVVKINWHIYGPDGDSITATTYGEAADAGDKAVSKAHSVAYRTALLQTLCIPTDEPDPDSTVHERQQQPRPVRGPSDRSQAWARLWEITQRSEPDLNDEDRQQYIKGELEAADLDGSRTGDLEVLARQLGGA